MADDQRLQQLKSKYQSALNMIQQQGVRLQNLHVQDNKLFIRGEAPSQDAKNRVWDQIKLVDPSYSDLTADITVAAGGQEPQPAVAKAAAAGAGDSHSQTYVVKSGDTLSKIAQQLYGNAQDYMKIFNANRDKLNDPNKIFPGQTLNIPQ